MCRGCRRKTLQYGNSQCGMWKPLWPEIWEAMALEEVLYAERQALAWAMEGSFGNKRGKEKPPPGRGVPWEWRGGLRETEEWHNQFLCEGKLIFVHSRGVTICAPHDQISHHLLVESLGRNRSSTWKKATAMRLITGQGTAAEPWNLHGSNVQSSQVSNMKEMQMAS